MKLSLVALVVFSLLGGASLGCSRRAPSAFAQSAERAFARVSQARLGGSALAKRAPGLRLYAEPARTDLR